MNNVQNKKKYWEKLRDKFNNSVLTQHFNRITTINDRVYLTLAPTEPNFVFSFNISSAIPRLDIYFQSSIYDSKKSRDAFVKKYNSHDLQTFSDNQPRKGSNNPDCRCCFVMEHEIADSEQGYNDGADWQINTLKKVYKNVLNINKGMIKNNEYEYNIPTKKMFY